MRRQRATHVRKEAAIERRQSREYPLHIDSRSEEEDTHAASKSTGDVIVKANFKSLIVPLRQAVAERTSELKRALNAKVKDEEIKNSSLLKKRSRMPFLRLRLNRTYTPRWWTTS